MKVLCWDFRSYNKSRKEVDYGYRVHYKNRRRNYFCAFGVMDLSDRGAAHNACRRPSAPEAEGERHSSFSRRRQPVASQWAHAAHRRKLGEPIELPENQSPREVEGANNQIPNASTRSAEPVAAPSEAAQTGRPLPAAWGSGVHNRHPPPPASRGIIPKVAGNGGVQTTPPNTIK